MIGAMGPALYLHARHRSAGAAAPTHLLHYISSVLILVLAQFSLPAGPTLALLAIAFLVLGGYLLATAVLLLRDRRAATGWLVTAVVSTGAVVLVNTMFRIAFPVSELVRINTTLLFALPIFALLFDELGAGRTTAALRARTTSPGRDNGAAEAAIEAITTYLEGGEFRRKNLTVKDIAVGVDLPIKVVSSVVNTQLRKSVPELITEYRINDVKARLIDPDNDRFTILALAEMSGFGSGPRFNTVFRDLVGMTPSEFKRKASKSAS